jgi:hypothetical protein
MPQYGGALNTHIIHFLDSFISDKGTRFLDPHTLLQALRKPPYYTRFLSFKIRKIEAKKTIYNVYKNSKHFVYTMSLVNNININDINDINDNNKNARNVFVSLTLSMSCDIFWKYEVTLYVDRRQFSRKYTNRTEEEALQTLSQFLCLRMKQHIEDDLIISGKRDMLSKLEEVFPKFHIHGQTSHEILYPNDPSNSAHCRGDGKIFICTHC